jgi:hypothetical protein
MASSGRIRVSLPFVTNTLLQTKPTILLGGSDAYQPLPRSLLAERNPLVVLVWSTNAYQSADLALTRGRTTFTNLYHRDGGQGTDSHIHDTVAGWVGWATVITVDNGRAVENTQEG